MFEAELCMLFFQPVQNLFPNLPRIAPKGSEEREEKRNMSQGRDVSSRPFERKSEVAHRAAEPGQIS